MHNIYSTSVSLVNSLCPFIYNVKTYW